MLGMLFTVDHGVRAARIHAYHTHALSSVASLVQTIGSAAAGDAEAKDAKDGSSSTFMLPLKAKPAENGDSTNPKTRRVCR